MQTVPPDQVGVGSAILTTGMQISTVISLAIQAGLLTLYPGGLNDYRNVKASWYLEMGWAGLWAIGFATLYRPGRARKDSKDIEGVVA
jgi:hypothetical protein